MAQSQVDKGMKFSKLSQILRYVFTGPPDVVCCCCIYTVSQKSSHLYILYNFVKS